jgi:hypothetical protein
VLPETNGEAGPFKGPTRTGLEKAPAAKSPMRAAEPTLATLSNPVRRYFFATRPRFLTITLLAALIGLATAFGSGIILNAATASVTS